MHEQYDCGIRRFHAKALQAGVLYPWTQTGCCLADDHELRQYRITENLVIGPSVTMLLKPTMDSSCCFDNIGEVERIPTGVTRHTRPRHY